MRFTLDDPFASCKSSGVKDTAGSIPFMSAICFAFPLTA
jgi:hypothetical protein